MQNNWQEEIIEEEIKWCELHLVESDELLSADYKNGFIAGLKQAQRLVSDGRIQLSNDHCSGL